MRLGYLEVFGYGEAARWVYAQAVEPGDWIGDAFLTVTDVPHAHHVAMSKVWEVAPNAREMSGFGVCPELLGGGHVK